MLLGLTVCKQTERSVALALSDVDFLRGPVMLSALTGNTFQEVGPTNFQTKWFVGRPRPEEVAWQIHEGGV